MESYRKVNYLRCRVTSLVHSSKEEDKAIKAIVGIISGIIIGIFIFLVYRYSFGYTFIEAAVLSGIITVLISTGLALSSFVRCIVALVVPNFFTGIGRTVLLSAIFALILNFPISSISYNAKATGSSLTCFLEIAINQTRLLQREMAIPSDKLASYVEKQHEDLKVLADHMKTPMRDMKQIFDLFEDESATIESISSAFQKVLVLCYEKAYTNIFNYRFSQYLFFFNLFQSCRKIVMSLEKECNELVQDIARNIKGFSNIFKQESLCKNLDFSQNCFFDIPLNLVLDEIRNLSNYFEVDMVISGESSGVANDSNPAAVKQEWENDIEEKIDDFVSVVSIIRKCMSLSMFLIFLQSFWYIRNYLTKDGYDNIYITKQFKQMDKEAKKSGKETVLPLTKLENDNYVNTSSFKLNSIEISYSKFGLIQVLLHFGFWVLVISFDYAVYYMLNLVKVFGNIEIDVNHSVRLRIYVSGDGPMAEFYKLLVNPYNLDRNFNGTLDIDPCLPEPQEPFGSMIPVFIILYVTALAVVLLRAYGMRLRRKVSAYYCPEQELARLDYLHKKIRHRRVGFLKFLRQQIKSAHKEKEVENKLRFTTWLAFNFLAISHILPKKEKLECTSCGQQDTIFSKVKLTKCAGDKGGLKCDAVYCEECFSFLQNTCPLCSMNEIVVLRG